METLNERLLSLLLDKEAEIKELNELLIQMNEKLQAVQNEYAKLYKLYLSQKNKKVKITQKIGYKTEGGGKWTKRIAQYVVSLTWMVAICHAGNQDITYFLKSGIVDQQT